MSDTRAAGRDTDQMASTPAPHEDPAPGPGHGDQSPASAAVTATPVPRPRFAGAQASVPGRVKSKVVGQARRVAKRLKNVLVRQSRVRVRQVDMDTVEVSRVGGLGWRRHRLDEPTARYAILPPALTVTLPDATALARLTASGLLGGKIIDLRLRLAVAPEPTLLGVRPLRVGRNAEAITWRRRGQGLELRLRWSKPQEVVRALADATSAVMRARPLDQVSGPVFALDRSAWLQGRSTWPHGHVMVTAPEEKRDEAGRPLGAFNLSPSRAQVQVRQDDQPVFTVTANPYGRRMVGAATRYRLLSEAGPQRWALRDEAGQTVARFDPATGVEAGLTAGTFDKYAVVTVDTPVRPGSFLAHAVRSLAACGVVFAAADPKVRAGLEALGAVAVADPGEVDDLRGYALSVEASRRMACLRDPVLRRTALGGEGVLPLPTVSVVLSSMRADYIDACLGYLARQTYPALEIVVGLHGYEVPEATRERWRATVPFPLRVIPVPAERPFGEVLGLLSRAAEGELVTKVDDDDRYGPQHVTDLVIAWHASGADVAAKGSRFVYFPEMGKTIDRAWAGHEVFNVTPAGGTLTLARSTLQQLGGWSHSSRHVDTDLLTRVKAEGGLVYRTHALEYVYVRRSQGHTWATQIEDLVAQGEKVYEGLPDEVLNPPYPARVTG